MKLTLSLTHRCNLACRYCYAGRSSRPDMSLDTARRSIDTALSMVPEGKRLELGLFGGEPLLRFDLVQAVTDYAIERADAARVPLRIGLTTNGTLISATMLDFIDARGISLCFSLDGPQHVHDRSRRLLNGQGSFGEVLRGLNQALERLGRVDVNAVFGPPTIQELPQSLAFIMGLGVRTIHFSPDITAAWTAESYSRCAEVFMATADYYIDCYRRGIELAVNLFDSKAVLFIKGGYAVSDRCAMGDGEWAVAPSGNLYPCERFIGEDDNPNFSLGNIHTGFDSARRCALRARRGNHRVACLSCRERQYCMGWCGCTNYFLSGRSDMPAPVLCALEQATINAARQVFGSLVSENNDCYVDHLFNYMNADSHRLGGNRHRAPLADPEGAREQGVGRSLR
jgi:uncharacterized protein